MSGGVRVAAIHAQKLADQGHDVLILSCCPHHRKTRKNRILSVLKGKQPKLGSHIPSHIDHIDVPHQVIRRSSIKDCDVSDADVVIATWWETAEWLSKLSPQKGAKAYFIQHHEVFDYLPKDRVAETYRLPLHKITISKWLVALMQDTYHDSDVSLVPNSVDTTQFYAAPRTRQRNPTVGMLYSSTPWKGCDISLEAINQVRQNIPNLKLVAFGTETPPAGTFPPGTQFYKQPRQDEIKNIYARCDIWLCGSWAEGFHLPPLEAMACRCPVVSTMVGGPIDIIENGLQGHLVPKGDSKALADKLESIFLSPEEEWKKMSEAAYQTAISYSWDDASAIFEKALYRAIEHQKGKEKLAIELVSLS